MASQSEQRGQATPDGQRKRVRSSRQRSSDANSEQTSKSVIPIEKIPLKTLIASVKRDVRQHLTDAKNPA
jgi:hypothetical protein